MSPLKMKIMKIQKEQVKEVMRSCQFIGIDPRDLHADGMMSDEDFNLLNEYGLDKALRLNLD